MAAPGTDTLRGKRDTAILALFLCTGVREAELASLLVQDLHQHLDGALALRVRRGKGMKQRLVPYGSLAWVVPIVTDWLAHARVIAGPVFRGFKRNGEVRGTAISVRAIQYILAA